MYQKRLSKCRSCFKAEDLHYYDMQYVFLRYPVGYKTYIHTWSSRHRGRGLETSGDHDVSRSILQVSVSVLVLHLRVLSWCWSWDHGDSVLVTHEAYTRYRNVTDVWHAQTAASIARKGLLSTCHQGRSKGGGARGHVPSPIVDWVDSLLRKTGFVGT